MWKTVNTRPPRVFTCEPTICTRCEKSACDRAQQQAERSKVSTSSVAKDAVLTLDEAHHRLFGAGVMAGRAEGSTRLRSSLPSISPINVWQS